MLQFDLIRFIEFSCLQEQAKELHEMRKIRDAIFNLSKGSNTSGSG